MEEVKKEVIITEPPLNKRRTMKNKTITFKSKTPAWSEGSDTIRLLTASSKNNQKKYTQNKNKTKHEKSQNTVQTENSTKDDSVCGKNQATDLEKKLMKRVANVNGKLDSNIIALKTLNNNTGLLVQKMIEQNEKINENNKAQDQRMDVIEKMMEVNNSEIKGM